MKKFISTMMMAAVLLVGLSSCNDSDPAFTVWAGDIYMMEDNGIYEPRLWFGFTNGNLKEAQVLKDGQPLVGYSPAANVYEVNSSYSSYYTTLSSVNGTYTLTAVSDDEQAYSATYQMNFEKELGPFNSDNYSNFAYNGTAVTISIDQQVENAEGYGLYIVYSVSSSTYPNSYALYKGYTSFVKATTGTNSQEISFNLSSSEIDSNIDYLRIYPAAAVVENGVFHIKLSSDYKTLFRGDSTFKEDAPQAQ